MIERTPEGRPVTRRELRRTEKCRIRIERWWGSLPAEARPPYVRGWVIVEATGCPIEHLAPALRLLGWRRVQYREHKGEPRLYWVPPGYPSPVRPVGRPPGSASNRMLPASRKSESPVTTAQPAPVAEPATRTAPVATKRTADGALTTA